MAQPGPIYDDAVKTLCRLWPQSLCRWLGVPVHGTARPIQLSSNLPVFARQVDALVAVDENTALHLEFQTYDDPGFLLRMLEYWVRLSQMPDLADLAIEQHVIVLGRAVVDTGLRARRLDYSFEVHYLRDHPVDEFLGDDPYLAPFATLAKLTDAERPEAFRAALDRVATVGDEQERTSLGRAAADLARLVIDRDTIDAKWKESAMPVPSFTQELLDEGREIGLEEGRAEAAAAALRRRFGADERITTLAHRLARLGPDEYLRQIDEAGSLDELD